MAITSFSRPPLAELGPAIRQCGLRLRSRCAEQTVFFGNSASERFWKEKLSRHGEAPLGARAGSPTAEWIVRQIDAASDGPN